jgi:hypothetical protein
VTFFAVIGSFVSFNLFISSSGFAPTLIAFIGSITAFFAVKREYFSYGFRGGSDRLNGPSGQH